MTAKLKTLSIEDFKRLKCEEDFEFAIQFLGPGANTPEEIEAMVEASISGNVEIVPQLPPLPSELI